MKAVSRRLAHMREHNSVDCPPGAALQAAPGSVPIVLAAPLLLGGEFLLLKCRDAAPLTLKVPLV